MIEILLPLLAKPKGMHECLTNLLEDNSEAKVAIPMISDTQVQISDVELDLDSSECRAV